jgi:TatD DNase family protein
MTPAYTDSHCHIDDRLPGGADGAVAAARAAGVERMITVGCDLASSRTAIEMAARFDDVFATVGVHPHEAKDGMAFVTELLSAPKVVAVGECGLDYHYDYSPREAQREVFAAQIALAHAHALPLVIHTREAWDDTFDVLAAEGVPERTVFHCFTGGPAEARRCLDLGAFVSFSGIVTFKSATDVQDAARLCPADRLLVETDSPYLAPVPHRGKPNRPALVTVVGEAVAALRGVTSAQVAAASTAAASVAFPGARL